MAEKILVALKSENPLGHIIPYLDKITQPGVRVVLLIPYQWTALLKSSRPGWEAVESVEEAASEWRKILKRYSPEEDERRLAEHKIFLAEEALRKRGVEVVTDVYVGRLRNVIRSYIRNGDVSLVIVPKRFTARSATLLRKARLFFSSFKKPAFSSWPLLPHASRGV